MILPCHKWCCIWSMVVLTDLPAWAAAQKTPAAKSPSPIELRGTVYEVDGRPADQAAVWAYPIDDNYWRMVETATDGDGRFRLDLRRVDGEW